MPTLYPPSRRRGRWPSPPAGPRIVGLIAILACAAASALAEGCPQHQGAAVPRERFHLYLLIGQSNMAGRGAMTPDDRQPADGVFVLDKQDQWRPAAHPLHFDKPKIAGVGLGLDFAAVMHRHDPDCAIGLIPCAVGGTRLDQWRKDGKLYAEAIRRATHAARCGVLKGILWHQGESDSTDELAGSYAKRLAATFADLRQDLGAPELPIVVGELGRFRLIKHPPTAAVNRQLRALPRTIPNAACAGSAGLNHNGDQTHFDAPALKEFGRRYAAKMLELQAATK